MKYDYMISDNGNRIRNNNKYFNINYINDKFENTNVKNNKSLSIAAFLSVQRDLMFNNLRKGNTNDKKNIKLHFHFNKNNKKVNKPILNEYHIDEMTIEDRNKSKRYFKFLLNLRNKIQNNRRNIEDIIDDILKNNSQNETKLYSINKDKVNNLRKFIFSDDPIFNLKRTFNENILDILDINIHNNNKLRYNISRNQPQRNTFIKLSTERDKLKLPNLNSTVEDTINNTYKLLNSNSQLIRKEYLRKGKLLEYYEYELKKVRKINNEIDLIDLDAKRFANEIKKKKDIFFKNIFIYFILLCYYLYYYI